MVARIGLSEQISKDIMKDLRIRTRSVVLNFYVRSYTPLESGNTILAEFVAANSNETTDHVYRF